MKLSHSKVQKYKECPARYKFYYVSKLRSKYLNSNLFFGSALDEALNCLLLSKKKQLSTEETLIVSNNTPESIFQNKLTNTRHNGNSVYIPQFEYAQYSRADWDSSILIETDMEDYFGGQSDLPSLEDWKTNNQAFMEWAWDQKKMEKKDLEQYLHLNWLSLRRRGFMLIEAYRNEVIPIIDEVYSVQEYISLPNPQGDAIDGVIDFTCSFKDEPNKIYIGDNKSSSKPYKQEQLTESDQLHTYAEHKGINNLCYIVLEKPIRKREPKVRISILKGSVVEKTLDRVFTEYETALGDIKEEKFSPNYDSGCYFYGKKCEYYDLCHNSKMCPNLVKLESKKDK